MRAGTGRVRARTHRRLQFLAAQVPRRAPKRAAARRGGAATSPGARRVCPPRAGAGARPAQAPGARRASKREAARRGGEANSPGAARCVRAWPYSLFRIQSQVSPGAARPAVPVPFRRLLSCKPPGAARPPASRWRRSVRRKLPRHGRSIVRHDHQAPGPPQTAAFSTGAPDKRPAAPLTAFHRGFGACLQRSRKYS